MWKSLKEIKMYGFPQGYVGGNKSIGENCNDQNTKELKSWEIDHPSLNMEEHNYCQPSREEVGLGWRE